MKRQILVTLLWFCIFPLICTAAENDSIRIDHPPVYKNVIKFNPTPMLLWDVRNLTFSYERILSPRQSFSVELGYLVFHQLDGDSLPQLINITSHFKQGINICLEYRFYLSPLNPRPIPAGLYLGPYLSFYGYEFKNDFDLIPFSVDSSGMIHGRYWTFNLGVELGYQFVFWKRLTLDMVLVGPSISYYGGKTEITGTLDGDQMKAINEGLYEKLHEKYPSLVQYMSIDKTYQETGKLDVFRMGFRYLLQIGFHF
jgi:hypothetical protein